MEVLTPHTFDCGCVLEEGDYGRPLLVHSGACVQHARPTLEPWLTGFFDGIETERESTGPKTRGFVFSNCRKAQHDHCRGTFESIRTKVKRFYCLCECHVDKYVEWRERQEER
jgi:hypothetical protein